MLWIILFAVCEAQSPVYGRCNSSFPYAEWIKQGKNITFPLKPVISKPGLQLSGIVQILDACTFAVNEFLYLGGEESYWYGAYAGSTQGIRICQEYVFASQIPTTRRFALTTEPGAEANFGGFNQLRLFDRNTNVLVATADLPDPRSMGAGSGAGSAGSSTKNLAFSMAIDSLLVALCIVLY